jgi:hypothetical protein
LSASSKPSPISTPFTAWVPINVAANRGVQTLVLRRVRARPRRDTLRAHLDDSANRVAVARAASTRSSRSSPTTEPATVTPSSPSSALAIAPAADDRSRVPGAGSFERVAHVGQPVLERASKVGRGPAAGGRRASSPSRRIRLPDARGSSPSASSRDRGSARAGRAACRACGRAGDLRAPPRCPARSAGAGFARSPAGAGQGRRRSRHGRARDPAAGRSRSRRAPGRATRPQ